MVIHRVQFYTAAANAVLVNTEPNIGLSYHKPLVTTFCQPINIYNLVPCVFLFKTNLVYGL